MHACMHACAIKKGTYPSQRAMNLLPSLLQATGSWAGAWERGYLLPKSDPIDYACAIQELDFQPLPHFVEAFYDL